MRGNPLRVLMVEDSEDDALLVLRELERKGGYTIAWKRVDTEKDLRSTLDEDAWDVIIADYSMPHFDGIDALRVVKERGLDVPFILVSGTVGEDTAVEAMRVGAHDYVMKDDLARLVPAIRRELGEVEVRRKRRESEAKFEAIFSSVTDGILLADLESKRFGLANEAVCRMLGYTHEEIARLGVTDIHPEDDLPYVVEQFERQARKEITVAVNIPVKRKDGTVFYADVSSSPIELGNKRYLIGIFRDVTERKRMEQELRTSHDRLSRTLDELKTKEREIVQQERLRALGEMASGIAHDFNNALSPIMGFSDLALRRPETMADGEKMTRYLQHIRKAAKDAAAVVARLRQFYRPREEGETHSPIDLNLLTEDIISITEPKWKNESLAKGKTITIETKLGEMPPVPASENEMREVLTNLTLNAVDAITGSGRITFRTSVEGENAVIEVADTGEGMSEESVARCMEPFFTTKAEHGTGLGLSVTHGIVRRHNGTISVASAEREGTTFTVRLPLEATGATEVHNRETADRFSRPLRILVVEDEPEIRELMTGYLAGDGHSIETADDGREGFEKFQTGRYDLVITDMSMPEMSGTHLASLVKETAPGKPVILLTGFGRMAEDLQSMPVEADQVVGKPVDLDSLRKAIAEVMSGSDTGT
jgi:PAS domain S-box-containing protein